MYKELLQLNIRKTNNLIKKGQKTRIDIFQKRYTDGQQTLEKVLIIPSHHGNANENHSLIPVRLYKIKTEGKGVGKDLEKKESPYTVGEISSCAITVEIV